MASSDPFAVLQIAPTLDPARVKRGYFSQLQHHPPHSDPEGFRELRAAYEALSVPGALPLAVLDAPVDAAAELERWRERWQAPMQQAAQQVQARAVEAGATSAFVNALSRCTLAEASARFAPAAPEGQGAA